MVDILTSRASNKMNEEDFEEGELVEEGEITDDEEDESTQPKTGVHPLAASEVKINEKIVAAATSTKRQVNSRTGEDVQAKTLPTVGGNNTKGSASEGATPVAPHVWGEGGDRDYRNPEGDKDYRWNHDNEGPVNGDLEYRSGDRRRRRTPSPDDYRKRSRVSPPLAPIIRGGRTRRPNRWTERQLCKFFREGYCRDGDNCAYSHMTEDSMRKAELCKYYQNGFCKKGLTCPLLHGEFPCKAFHKGECTREPCQFSHLPLTDYTRPLFEQMMRDEQLSARLQLPQQQMRRRVLLPGGPLLPPPTAAPPTAAAPSRPLFPPLEHLPPPSVVVPTLCAPPAPSLAMPPPMADSTPPQLSGHGEFNISQMLAQIAGSSVCEEAVDSPASPPAPPLPSDIPLPVHARYRLLPVDADPPYSSISSSLITSAAQTDPRIARLLSSQFDAVSSLIAAAPPPQSPSASPSACPAPSTASPSSAPVRPVDPRQISAVRDPRRRPDERGQREERPRMSWMPQISG